MTMTNPALVERDQAELLRGRDEAKNVILKPCQVERYLKPTRNSAYPLEYAFFLLGDARGKRVLDLGCGTGENILPLAARGACVTGLDISPELIELSKRRLEDAGVEADLQVGSAYNTGLPSGSVDVIFCIALVHHLDIPAVCNEMQRVLAGDGVIILSEPVRFSAAFNRFRNLLPVEENISQYEHPLTRDELGILTKHFRVEEARYFRLPWLPLLARTIQLSALLWQRLWHMDRWILHHFPGAQLYATNVTMRLRRLNQARESH